MNFFTWKIIITMTKENNYMIVLPFLTKDRAKPKTSSNDFEVSFHFKVIRGWILPWQNEVREGSNEHVTASDCQEIKTDLITLLNICKCLENLAFYFDANK